MKIEVKCKICGNKDLTYKKGEYEGFYCNVCNDICEVEIIEQTKNECSTKGNMIIGNGKIEMSESDFIELATRLGNDIDVCSFKGNNCVNDCACCWSKYLNKFISI